MIFINENGTIKRADGKDINEVVIKNKSQFETVGDPNVVYIAKDENKIYRYDTTASDYVLIGGGGGGESYDAGNGIIIENGTISIDGEVVATKEDLESYRTSSEQDEIDAGKQDALGFTPENVANKISTLAQATDNTKYLGAKVVKDELQNVREVAEGKNKNYVLSYNQTAPTEETFNEFTLYKEDGTEIETWEEFQEYVGENKECVNHIFNSQDDVLEIQDYYENDDYLLLEPYFKDITPPPSTTGYLVVAKIKLYDTYEGDGVFKQGNNFYVIETDVPDRWFGNYNGFYKLETAKVDLSNYVDLSSAQIITGVKTFTAPLVLSSTYLRIVSRNDYKWEFYNDGGGAFLGIGYRAINDNLVKRYNFANSAFYPASNNSLDLGISSNHFREAFINKLTGATQSANTDDIINGTFNVINASDITSNTLTQAQYDLITNGKPTLIKGTLLNRTNPILLSGKLATANSYEGFLIGTTNVSNPFNVSLYAINTSTKVISLSGSNRISLTKIAEINGMNVPTKKADLTKQYRLVQLATSGIFDLVEDGGTITSTSTAPSLSLASGNEYSFTNALTSLNIVSLETSTGDTLPRWEVSFTAGSGFALTLPASISWKYGTPTFESGEQYTIYFKGAFAYLC